jgi:glycosyltransferase involved in cell wall biosynthesis
MGVELIDLHGKEKRAYPWWLESHLMVRRAIEALDLDHVVVQDWQGLGALLTEGPPVCGSVTTWIHGGDLYDSFGAGKYLDPFSKFFDTDLERTQLQTSDWLVSPSAFMIDWYRRQGWSIDETRSRVIPYLVGEPEPDEVFTGAASSQPVLAFIGRLSKRKGFDRFIDLLEDNRDQSDHFKVRIFGGTEDFSPKVSEKRIGRFGFDVRIETDWTTSQIWSSLASDPTLILCPSRLDNSPNVVYEAAVRGHHTFLWPNNGASELQSHFPGRVHTWTDLESALAVLSSTTCPIQSADRYNESILGQWLGLLEDAHSATRNNVARRISVSVSKDQTLPVVSVVIASRNRRNFLTAAIDSLITQDLDQHFEIVIVDDASDESYSVEDLPSPPLHIGILIERNEARRGPGASRNRGARAARSDLIVFADDDNLLRPDHLASLLSEFKRTGAHVVIPSHTNHASEGVLTPCRLGESQTETVFLGDHLLPVGFLVNTIGDTNFLIRRDTLESVGGWSEEWPNALEDWELLTRIISAGYRAVGTLRPTVAYRVNTTGVQANLVDGFAYRRLDIAASHGKPDVDLHTLTLARAAYMSQSMLTPRAVSLLARRALRGFRAEPLRYTAIGVKLLASYPRRRWLNRKT